MVQYGKRFLAPNSSRVIKRPDQLSTFGIHADDWKLMGGIVPDLGANVSKL